MAAGRENDLVISARRPELSCFCLVAHSAPYSCGQSLCSLWRHVYFYGHTVAVGNRGHSPNNLGYRGSQCSANRHGNYYVCATHHIRRWPIGLAPLAGTAYTPLRSVPAANHRGVTLINAPGIAIDVLLIIYMQDASFYESDTFDSNGVISRINQLSEYLCANEGRVIFIQHDGTAEEGLSPNTSGWEILSALTRTDSDIIIRKTTNDAFYNTELHDVLAGINPEKLIISGWATDFCVDTTVRSSVSHNYNVVVASDCHTLSNRPHLQAEQIIEHHNWVWRNLITPAKEVEVSGISDGMLTLRVEEC